MPETSNDEHLSVILKLLNSGAVATPLVEKIRDSAARIFVIAPGVRRHTDQFRELAEGSCRLAFDIIVKLKDKQDLIPNSTPALEELQGILESILNFGKKCAFRGVVNATLMHTFDAKKIKEHRMKLDMCMCSFQFRSLHDLRERTNQLVQQHSANGDFIITSNANGTEVQSNTTVPQSIRNSASHHNNENTITIGEGAKFSGSGVNDFESGRQIDCNSNNTTNDNTNVHDSGSNNVGAMNRGGNGTRNVVNSEGGAINRNGSNTSQNRSDAVNSGSAFNTDKNQSTVTAPATNGRGALGNAGHRNDSNSVSFGSQANFSDSGTNVFGSGNQIYDRSNNENNNMNVHNNGSNNTNVQNRGDNSYVHVGNNNANNRGIIGHGDHNVISSGNGDRNYINNGQNNIAPQNYDTANNISHRNASTGNNNSSNRSNIGASRNIRENRSSKSALIYVN